MAVANEIIAGRFHLRTSHGPGAWGELFAAEDRPRYGALTGGLTGHAKSDSGDSVVIEVVHPASLLDGVSVEAIERDMKTIKTAAAPHLLKCLDCGRDNAGQSQSLLYLAMECWQNSLEDRLKSPNTISEQELELIASTVAQALAFLHTIGIHHAGVHPKRIVCVGDDWKLVPSGPAASAGPKISPPEHTASPAEDVFAFGITFLHAFLAARGHETSIDRLVSDHERWLALLPEAKRASLSRCLQKDPKRRCTFSDLVSAKTRDSRPVIDWALEQPQRDNDEFSDLKRREQIDQSTVADLERRKHDLEGEVGKVEAEIMAAQTDRTIRLGLFGVRGSGKSSLLAVWSLFCVDRSDPRRQLQLRFPHDDSLHYLKEVRTPILKEGRSRATAMAEPKTILFEIVLNGDAEREVWTIETMDFSGEFVELMADKTGVRTFAKQTHDFLQKSNVVLCCHRWDDDSQETLEAINRVLANYESHFVLALTRLDERGEMPQSPEELEALLQLLEQGSPTYFGNLIAKIKDIYRETGRAGIMAICPLGKNFSDPRHFPRGRELSVEDLAPIAIHEPLRYAVERRKEMEPQLQRRLQRLKAELAAMEKDIAAVRAVHDRQHQDDRKKLRDELSALRELLLRCSDKGKAPCQEDRHALMHLARKADELNESAMKHECSELFKLIANDRGRRAAWRQRLFELVVLALFALLLGASLLWFAWTRVTE